METMLGAKVFTEAEVEELLPMTAALEAVESSLRAWAAGEAGNLPRRRIQLPTGVLLHSLEAWVRLPALAAGGGEPHSYCGFKIYTSSRSGARFLVGLFNGEDGAPLAFFEADRLGQRRTGAATGVATRCLAKTEARQVAILGAGWQAESQLEAIRAATDIASASVYSRSLESTARFAADMSERLQIPVSAAATAAAAVEGADIIVTATTARLPVLPDSAVGLDAHINAMGANSLGRAEMEPATVRRAGRIVVDSVEQCRLEAGDLAQAFADDDQWRRVEELGRVLHNGACGHRRSGISIFKSVGLALWDVAAAARIYETWHAAG